MKKLLFIIIIAATSCTLRARQSFNRGLQFTDRNFKIEMYSGNNLVFKDSFYGIINQEEHTDGIYYFKGDTMIEVSGNYILKSTK